MSANVSLRKLYQHFEQNCPRSNWKIYIDSFFFQCKVNNLTEKTLQVYAERLFYFARYLSEKEIDVDDVIKQTITDKKTVSPTTSAKVDRIKEVMQSGEFSMGELSKLLDWPFQKIRQTCRKIAKQERKSLKSVSRGRWKLE